MDALHPVVSGSTEHCSHATGCLALLAAGERLKYCTAGTGARSEGLQPDLVRMRPTASLPRDRSAPSPSALPDTDLRARRMAQLDREVATAHDGVAYGDNYLTQNDKVEVF